MKRETCPKCGSDDIYRCRSKKEPNGDCFECGGCGILLENSRLVVAHYKVTTYDELVAALKESREAIEELMELKNLDFKDTEKLLLRLDALYQNSKPRKAGK